MCDPNVKIIYTKLFIDNEFVESKSGKKFATINPTTEEVITEVYLAGKEDVKLFYLNLFKIMNLL